LVDFTVHIFNLPASRFLNFFSFYDENHVSNIPVNIVESWLRTQTLDNAATIQKLLATTFFQQLPTMRKTEEGRSCGTYCSFNFIVHHVGEGCSVVYHVLKCEVVNKL
jgi:hypothetical protein